MRPLISVIVPAYRHEAYIDQCLQGIAAQKGAFDLEVVVCDDASEDQTAVIAKRWAERDERILVHSHPENLGPSKNFEFALKRCRGKYVAYCEGDDYWSSPDKLSAQMAVLEEHGDTDLAYSQYGKINEAGEIVEGNVPVHEGPLFYLKDLIDDHGPSMNSILVRRDVLPTKFPKTFHRVPNPDVFILAAALRRRPGRFVPGVYSMYRVHPGGIWSGKAQAEKNLIRYSTLAEVFKWISRGDRDAMKRIHAGLESALLVARRKHRPLFDQYAGKLPWKRRFILKSKWLYAHLLGK